MSKRDHPRAVRRMNADPRNVLFMKRFDKFMNWFNRKEKSESNAVVLIGEDWTLTGGRRLIHKGRKP